MKRRRFLWSLTNFVCFISVVFIAQSAHLPGWKTAAIVLIAMLSNVLGYIEGTTRSP